MLIVSRSSYAVSRLIVLHLGYLPLPHKAALIIEVTAGTKCVNNESKVQKFSAKAAGLSLPTPLKVCLF